MGGAGLSPSERNDLRGASGMELRSKLVRFFEGSEEHARAHGDLETRLIANVIADSEDAIVNFHCGHPVDEESPLKQSVLHIRNASLSETLERGIGATAVPNILLKYIALSNVNHVRVSPFAHSGCPTLPLRTPRTLRPSLL